MKLFLYFSTVESFSTKLYDHKGHFKVKFAHMRKIVKEFITFADVQKSFKYIESGCPYSQAFYQTSFEVALRID
jgi:hypothetical protein